MAIPPWTIEMLRRGLGDVAKRATEPETLEKIKSQATEILHDLPETAARGIDAVMRSADAGKKSVQRWSRKQTSLSIPLLNASGVLVNEAGTGIPASDLVIETGVEFLRGDVVTGGAGRQQVANRLNRSLPNRDDYAIAVASSFPAALTAFSLLIEQRQLVVHRRHAIRMSDGQSLPDAINALLPVVEEVGSADSFLASDFDSFESFCAIVADSGEHPVELIDFGKRDCMQAVVLPIATLTDSHIADLPSAESTLQQGADFVIFPGDIICGGPSCGIIVGRREEVESITATPQWHALQASLVDQAMTAVAMAATPKEIPVIARMLAGEENLNDRAERMATRLRGSDVVASCHVTANEARVTGSGRWRLPSRQICIQHQSLAAADWLSELRKDMPSVLASQHDGSLVVDLRWIAASDDGRLADALVGKYPTS